ncbi:transcription antitermination protein NusB-like isoform X1 [Phoenix dactylifera]|nr:transcription antitermination protein NusB-like isoform X1 [Phoenix dactylifera]
MGDPSDDHQLPRSLRSLRPITFLMQDQPAARILELCILHLAMAEVTVLGTRHQIVINEAVDLAKRFYDGCAPRIINGCLWTFVKDFSAMDAVQSLDHQKLEI